ncbi:MAG: InlB B-repeat-containing protein [Clostridiales bacterium]|nr:InlB B-repeat-containing protein [Clostridiales bacterium]
MTQITVTSEDLTLNEAGLHSFDMQFVFQINRGEIPQEEYYNVTYDGNGATENVPNDSTDYTHNQTVEVSPQGNMEYDGYIFTGWNTESDGSGTAYIAEDTFNITEDTTLYAQWVERAEAQIVSIPFKDAFLSGNEYDEQTATVLGNMTYGMLHYIYIYTSTTPNITISQIAEVQFTPTSAYVEIIYKKNSTEIGYTDVINLPTNTSSQVVISIEVYQEGEQIAATALYLRKLP